MSVRVLDVYSGNRVDWDAEAASGVKGVLIKGGQGHYPQYAASGCDFIEQAERVGMAWGIYWQMDARYSPEGCKAAIKNWRPDGNFGQLGLWLACELPYYPMTDAQWNALPYSGYKPIESIWRGMYAAYGVYPGIYTSISKWNLIFCNAPDALHMELAQKSDLWVAQYKVIEPEPIGAWYGNWSMWQYTENPDYSQAKDEWWERKVAPPEAYIVKRPYSTHELGFTQGEGALPLKDAVTAASENGWDAAMNGGAGFDYTDATHAIPRTEGFEKVQGIPYARRLLTMGVINPALNTNYLAPWCILAFDILNIYLIVTRGREGEYGMTQAQAAEYVKALGCADAYLMDSGRSAQIEEGGQLIYWPYAPDEKVPQHVGLKRKLVIGGSVKGVAKYPTNIKATVAGQIPNVAQLQIGQYVYGTLIGSTLTGDLVGFSHFYKADGTVVNLGIACKAYAGNLTLTNEAEPVEPPPPPPTATTKQIELIDDGVVWKGTLTRQ